MSKGNRNRANKKTDLKGKQINHKSINYKKPDIKKPKPSSQSKQKTIYEEFPIGTFTQDDVNYFKELVTLSNNVASLIQDYADREIAIINMKKMSKEILKEKEPLLLQITKNLFKTERNYRKIASQIHKQSFNYEKLLIITKGQLSHRYEDYVSALIRFRYRLDKMIGNAKLKSITGHRSGKKIKEKEEQLFEAEFNEEGKLDESKKAELEKLMKEYKKQKEQKLSCDSCKSCKCEKAK